jgi:hypothetical protein
VYSRTQSAFASRWVFVPEAAGGLAATSR